MTEECTCRNSNFVEVRRFLKTCVTKVYRSQSNHDPGLPLPISWSTKHWSKTLMRANANGWNCKMSITSSSPQTDSLWVRWEQTQVIERQWRRQKGRQRTFSFTKGFSWIYLDYRWRLWGKIASWLPLMYVHSVDFVTFCLLSVIQVSDNKVVRMPLKRQ